jgi:antagonist of KipI
VLKVIQPGLLTTVQDIGRPGYISRGIAPGGAFDNFSFRIGNLLVGNQTGGHSVIFEKNSEAGLEMTLLGPKLEALDDLVIAITGADMSPVLDSKLVSMWKSFRLKKGSILSFRNTKQGVRSYLCVAGGIDIPLFLGSRSTFVQGELGGLEGRGLKTGDKLYTKKPTAPFKNLVGRYVLPDVIPKFWNKWIIRVILGPQDYLFKEESVKLFLETEWKASHDMDRTGIRLNGPKLDFKPRPEYLIISSGTNPSNILADPYPIGGIIVPGGSELIICGVESPGVGGYAKIATVISTDLSLVAQIRPGDLVTFKALTIKEALRALRQKDELINESNIVKERSQTR